MVHAIQRNIAQTLPREYCYASLSFTSAGARKIVMGAKLSLGGATLPTPSLPLPPLPFPFPSPSVPSPPSLLLLSLPLPLRSRPPTIQLGGLGERCKLPQRSLGRVPADKRFGAF